MLVGYEGQSAGAWGDIGCFSTYVAHLITTGVGGIAITDDPDYAKTMRSLVNHGLSYGDLSGDSTHFEPQRTRRDFVFDRVGHSFRITELEAAIGLAQLETWRGIILGRQANAVALTERLRDYEQYLQLPTVRPGAAHAWMMYPLVCRVEGARDRLMAHLEVAGIGSRRMLPLTCQPVYRGLFCEDDYPVAKWINENGFYIGCHQGLGPGDLDYMAEVIGGFFE